MRRTAALRLAVVGLLALVLGAAVALVVVRGHPAPEHTRAFPDEDRAARAVLAALRGQGSLDDAKALVGDRDAWVTTWIEGAPTTRALADVAALPPEQRAPAERRGTLQVDIGIAAPFAAGVLGPFALGVDPGLDGARTADGAHVPAALVARGMGRGALARFLVAEDASPLRTYALVETSGGPRRILLGALFPEANVDGARLLRAASLGGHYLAHHVKRDRRFDYEIDASTGKAGPGYNALRHAGTTYAMLQLVRALDAAARAPGSEQARLRGEVLAQADVAMRWIVDNVRDDPKDATRAYLREGRKIKLGGAALALLAMVERLQIARGASATSEALEASSSDAALVDGVAERAPKLARFLLSQQDDEGHFASYYAPTDAFEDDARDSIYYPGEAVLALARFAALEEERAPGAGAVYRAAAEKGARYLVDRDHVALGLRVRMPVDAWLLLGIELLDRSAQWSDDDAVLVHAQRITRQIMREQYLDDDAPLPMRGARADDGFGSLVSTGSRMEALGAAAALEARRSPREDRVRRAAIANAAYGMRFQYDEDRVFLTKPAARALGGVPTSVVDPRIRIDGVQHNMSGWLLLAAVLDGRELP